MQSISTIGLDIAKSVFQVHGVDATGLGARCAANLRRAVARLAALRIKFNRTAVTRDTHRKECLETIRQARSCPTSYLVEPTTAPVLVMRRSLATVSLHGR
jgi:hypothetical protein